VRSNGLWWVGISHEARVKVPNVPTLRKEIVAMMHDPPVNDHRGVKEDN
jgi:hypothetical protein